MKMIDVIRKSDDGFIVNRWTFITIDNDLVLDGYEKFKLPSRRHKIGKPIASYSRLFGSRSSIFEADVPWPDDVREEALAKHVSTIRVGRWKTDFGR
jgi:hypothetical protein